MNSFDLTIISFLNGFARQSWTFDAFMVFLSGNKLFKGGVLIAVLWSMWVSFDKDRVKRHDLILCTPLSCFLALLTARILALTLPFRSRPLHTSELGFLVPYEMRPRALETWSSFPSDHATLFFSLAAAIFFMSRAMGVLAFTYVFGVIALPRIYLGLHFPTDIIAAALIGVAITYGITSSLKIRDLVYEIAMLLYRKSPGAFYACFFILTYQMANLFAEVRAIGEFAFSVLREIVRRVAS